MAEKCFECGRPAEVAHHVVPASSGGTKTIPLCGKCHQLAHQAMIATPTLTRLAMERKKARGERIGMIPYGYHLAEDEVHVEVDVREQAVMRRARELRADGLSLRKIGEQLEVEEMFPRSGGKWHAKTVRTLVEAASVLTTWEG